MKTAVRYFSKTGNTKKLAEAAASAIGTKAKDIGQPLKESTYKQMKSFAAEAGIPIDEREFHCRSSFMGMHKGKPDQSDIENVKKFAKEITM